MITADQLACHAVGDYVLQSHWMATTKTRWWVPAALHAVLYGLPFLLLTQSPIALAVIVGTHFVIDRWRLARHVCWFKNWYFGGDWGGPSWGAHTATGYPEETPSWLAVWLMIIADNTLHVLINGVAIKWLG